MTPAPATCEPSTSLRLVAQLMADHDCAAIPLTAGGKLVGIITDRDIAVRGVAYRDDAVQQPASVFMSSPCIAVGPDEPLANAIALMSENAIHHLPVIEDDGRLVGIVAQSDIGRRMTNREFGQLARNTSIRMKYSFRRVDAIARRDH